MGKELPLIECAFGWGRVFRLYSDYLEIKGIPYALSALTHVCPTFRTVMGIPSARLELWFGKKRVLLRGIASLDDARVILEYLSSWCQQELALDSGKQPTRTGNARQQKRGRKRPGESLPTIPVPVRLLSGEEAYYSVIASLCGEPIGEDSHITYPARDQGTLILTNRRMIYIGRTSQVVIDYAHLLHVSHLHGAIAIETDYRSRREIFELREPEECAHYLEMILARSVSSDEVETDGLIRRNWQMERMRTRLRDTEDFQERWQERGTGTVCVESVESAASAGSTKDVEDVEDLGSVTDKMPDYVADVLSQEVGGNE